LITGLRPFLIERPEPPPVYAHLPDFTLVSHEGQPVARADLEGTVWVVGFVFTRCVTLCPPVSQAMVRMQEHLARSRLLGDVRLLTVTVDPLHDTPEVLKEYADKIGADLSSWDLVTGELDEITTFVTGGFMLAVGERRETEAGIFDIAHSSKLALVDRNGGVRGVYSTDDEGLEELYHRVLRVLRIPLQEG
jgi:protein SCO1/2